jgi:ribose/xylose/arabinose/galactoside ABC-type transport system permease subunit
MNRAAVEEAGPATTVRVPGRPRRNPLRLVGQLGPLVGLLAVWLLFAGLKGHDFVKWDNQRLMLLQTAVVGTAAVGATIIIISGGIDLSVGSAIALCTVAIALLLQAGFSSLAAAAGGVAAGMLCGAAIGSMVIGHVGRVAALLGGVVTIVWALKGFGPVLACVAGLAAFGVLLLLNELYLKRVPLPPFIVTLGMWGALRGAAKGLADEQVVDPGRATWVADLMAVSKSGIGAVLPPGVWILLGLALLVACVLRYTRFGRHVFAIGSNEQTARLCGIAVERSKLMIYIAAGACTGVAGCLQFAYLSLGDPTTADGYELKVIASVVIGGASLTGGEGGILGTLAGALIMTVVDNGCTKLGLHNWVQEIVTGGIIVAAVALDRLRHRRIE